MKKYAILVEKPHIYDEPTHLIGNYTIMRVYQYRFDRDTVAHKVRDNDNHPHTFQYFDRWFRAL